MTAPGIWLGVVKKPGAAGPSSSRWLYAAAWPAMPPPAGVAHERAQGPVGLHAVVGYGPPLCVHVRHHVVLDQGGQPEVVGGERAAGVVRREAPGLVRRSPGVVVDAHEHLGVGIVGTDVAGAPRRRGTR